MSDPTRAELVEMADESGKVTLVLSDRKVTFPLVRPLVVPRRRRRNIVKDAQRRRKLKVRRAWAVAVICTWERASELREIEALMDEMVAEGTAVKTPGGYRLSEAGRRQVERERLVDELHSRRHGGAG